MRRKKEVIVAVSLELDKVVVVIGGEAYGFSTLSNAIIFVEEQLKGEQDYSKIINKVTTALGDDKDGELGIYDIETFSDLFLDEDEDDE